MPAGQARAVGAVTGPAGGGVTRLRLRRRCPTGPAAFIAARPSLRPGSWCSPSSQDPDTILPGLLGPATMQLGALRELDAQPMTPTERQPWIDILADVMLLVGRSAEPTPEEKTIMTELRQRWEREKAELRAEGRRKP